MGIIFLAALAVAVEPSRLPVGSPTITARILIDAPSAKTLRLWSSIGSVSEPQLEGEGRWSAIFAVPTVAPPSYAVVAAWDEATGEAGMSTIALEAKTEIPVETEPYAHVFVMVGGKKSSTRADARGHAKLVVWVGPDTKNARVTAVDGAGNTTVDEVRFDHPTGGTWLVAPAEVVPDEPARVFAFSTGQKPPKLRARGAELAVETQPGIARGRFRASRDVTIVAIGEGGEAVQLIKLRGANSTGSHEFLTSMAKWRGANPRWEIGVGVGPRFSGDFVGAGAGVEWRTRIRNTRFHVGVDLTGIYADGSRGADSVEVGGAGARFVAEARFHLTHNAALVIDAAFGGVVVHERRTPTVGTSRVFADGGPTLAAGGGVLARWGPGLFALRLEYAWTPLVGLALANLDGGMLTVGYRYGRW